MVYIFTQYVKKVIFGGELHHILTIFFHWLYSPLGLWPLMFSFMIILQTVGLLGRVITSSQGLYLNTGQHKHRINRYTYQTSVPCVGFEPMISASERAKTVHALDRSATVTGWVTNYSVNIIQKSWELLVPVSAGVCQENIIFIFLSYLIQSDFLSLDDTQRD
jgi:hypothetical protein